MERIDTPDKADAVYAAGLAFAMKDTDPKYPAMVIGNYVLGAGTLSSRLGKLLPDIRGTGLRKAGDMTG